MRRGASSFWELADARIPADQISDSAMVKPVIFTKSLLGIIIINFLL